MSFFRALLTVAICLTPVNLGAKEPTFRTVNLGYGLSIEVPRHWNELSIGNRENLKAYGESVLKNAGEDGGNPGKETLLAINATPNPVGAMIRLSVISPPKYTQDDLKGVGTTELRNLQIEFHRTLKMLEKQGGPEVLEVYTPRIEEMRGKRALALEYKRVGIVGPSPWYVTQYKIPTDKFVIEMTLSYRMEDAVIWRPIQERVKRSLTF